MAGPIAENMQAKLTKAFAPTALKIIDQSDRHAGHGGADPRGESHFRVEICSETFAGLSRVDRQRRIYEVLAEEMKERVHALSLSAKAPGES